MIFRFFRYTVLRANSPNKFLEEPIYFICEHIFYFFLPFLVLEASGKNICQCLNKLRFL